MIPIRPLIIFDLDGTLCNIKHRAKHIANMDNVPNFKKDWAKFRAEWRHDTPIEPTVRLLNHLQMFADIKIFTARNAVERDTTFDWLDEHCQLLTIDMQMRSEKDRRCDTEVKLDMYNALSQEDKDRILCCFEDRDRCVKMWRDLGLICHQVDYGNF